MVDPRHHRHYLDHVESVGLPPVQVRQRQLGDQPSQQLHETANVQQHVQDVHGKSEPRSSCSNETKSVYLEKQKVFGLFLNIFKLSCDISYFISLT